MLAHAFRFVERVVFVVGDQNVRSQRALARIGARLVDARDTTGPDGTRRRVVIFAIDRSA